jgi:DNA-binding transcriptional LysR family regulator
MVEGHYADTEHTVSKIRQQKEFKLVVKLGIVDSLCASLAPALIQLLSHQARQISIASGISQNMAQDLINKDVDIIITSDPLDGVDGLSRHFLCSEPLPLIRYSRRSVSGKSSETHFSRLCLAVPVKVEADTSHVVLSMVAEGLCGRSLHLYA